MSQPQGLRVGILTREYPPHVYGGAGVHVDFLVAALRELGGPGVPDDMAGLTVDVHALGPARPGAFTYPDDDEQLVAANPALGVLSADVAMAAALGDVDLAHSHTWYANAAGHLAALVHDVPHVVTAHSLEPLRPWKSEQLGGGYRLSSWVERAAYEAADAVIAVSAGMRDDVLATYSSVDEHRVHVVHNGVDTELYRPEPDRDVLDRLGVDDSRPYVAFVGRITRQKGVSHLLRAAARLPAEVQLVLLAGAADTPELARETTALTEQLRAGRTGIVVVEQMLPREAVRQVLSHAAAFCCPSVYEPLGIVNLEAMACGTAVVASAVGGIPEVVADGETGLLVPYDAGDTDSFEAGLAEALTRVVTTPSLAAGLGRAGRERAVREFSWASVAARTAEVYRSVR